MALIPPTGDRMIVLTSQPTMLRGRTITSAPASWPAKDPTEFLTYGVDFRPLIQSGAPIAELAPPFAPGVTIGAVSFAGSVVLVEIGGGADGTAVPISLQVRLSTGEVLTRTIVLPIAAQWGSGEIGPFGGPSPVTGILAVDARTGQAFIDAATGLPWRFPVIPGAHIGLVDAATGQVIIDAATNQPWTAAIP